MNSKSSIAFVGLVCAVITAVMLAINNIAQDIYYDEGGTLELVLIGRYALFIGGGLILIPMLRRTLWPGGQVVLRSTVSGITYAIGMLALLMAFQFIPISLAVLVLYTFPIFTALLEAIAEQKWPGVTVIIATVVAFAGLAIALGIGFGGASSTAYDWRGIACATVASLGFAITFYWNERLLSEVDAVTTTFLMKLFGVAIIAGFIALSENSDVASLPPDAFWPLIVALAGYIVAFITMVIAVPRFGASETAMVMNIEPICTMALAAGYLGQQFGTNQIVGAAIVIGAVLFAQTAARHETTGPTGFGEPGKT